MNLGLWEIMIVALVIVLLFGARKMPQMAKSLGQSMRAFKAETKGMREDRNDLVPAAADMTDQPGRLTRSHSALPRSTERAGPG